MSGEARFCLRCGTQREVAIPFEARLRATEQGPRVLARASVVLDEDPIARMRVSGPVSVRTIADVSPSDPFEFTTPTRIEGRVRAREPTAQSTVFSMRSLVIEEETRGRALFDGRTRPTRCVAAGDFDIQIVIQMIRDRQREIRACYEAQLRNNVSLAGRLKVSLTIQPDGSVTGVRIVESSMPEPGGTEVGYCVHQVISSFRFAIGPVGGSVTYQFPFVFEPGG